MEAGRAFASGFLGVADEAADDAARFGIDPVQLPARRELMIWPENAPAFEAFLAAATQWRACPGPGGATLLGLDYAGAAVAWAARQIVLTGDLMARLLVIETAARDALNARLAR